MGLQKWFAPLFIVGLLLAGCIAPVTPEAPEDTPIPGEEPAKEQPAATHRTLTTSCVVVLPNLRVVACDEAIPPVTHAERDTACMSIVPFEGRMAAVIASNNGLVAGWSFGVNFDAARDGRPLGCLRIYHLSEELSSAGMLVPVMEPVDQGGIVVDTCTVDPTAAVVSTAGEARICGSGSVTCALALGAWFLDPKVGDLVNGSDYAMQDPTAAGDIAGLTADGDMAPYPDLTLVARTRWTSSNSGDPECTLTSAVQPLFNFTPDGESAPQHALTLYAVEQGTSLTFEPECANNPAWLPEDQWNTTYSTLIQEPTGVFREYGNADSATGGWTSTACNVATPPDVTFWLGPGTLTIGALEGAVTDGIIDGVLIDPLDSRPPS